MPRPLRSVARAFVLCVATAVVAPTPASAGPTDDVEGTTQAWVSAYNSRDPKQIVALYAPDAVFWGTGSPVLRDTPESIADYFSGEPSRPNGRVELGAHRVRVWGDVAASTGSYTFTDVRNGETVRRPARFSFVYHRVNGRWMIVDHHSSAVPAAPGGQTGSATPPAR